MATFPVLSSLLLLLLVAVAAGAFWVNYRHNRHWQQEAERRGWRYKQVWWQRRRYQLAGMMANEVVWELTRLERDGYFFYRWHTYNKPLPFGSLVIWPRGKVAVAGQPGRPISVGSEAWQAQFVTFASHNQLAQWIVVPELELALRDWPTWPELGSLERIVWNQNRLEIYGRFQRDWITLDRLVVLGEVLVKSLAAH